METKNKTQKGEFIKFVQNMLANCGIQMTSEDLARRTIGTPEDFMRPLLIEVVKDFQEKTGIILLSQEEQPLKWLPPFITMGMIDDEFSEGCPRNDEIRERIKAAKMPKIVIRLDNLRPTVAKKYAAYCGLAQDESFEQRKVMECYSKDFPGTKDWRGPIFDVEDDVIKKGASGTLQKDGTYLGWITPETTVAELLDVFQDCFGK